VEILPSFKAASTCILGPAIVATSSTAACRMRHSRTPPSEGPHVPGDGAGVLRRSAVFLFLDGSRFFLGLDQDSELHDSLSCAPISFLAARQAQFFCLFDRYFRFTVIGGPCGPAHFLGGSRQFAPMVTLVRVKSSSALQYYGIAESSPSGVRSSP